MSFPFDFGFVPCSLDGDRDRLADLRPELLDEIEAFFAQYNSLAGKQFVPVRRGGPVEARRLVEVGMERFVHGD